MCVFSRTLHISWHLLYVKKKNTPARWMIISEVTDNHNNNCLSLMWIRQTQWQLLPICDIYPTSPIRQCLSDSLYSVKLEAHRVIHRAHKGQSWKLTSSLNYSKPTLFFSHPETHPVPLISIFFSLLQNLFEVIKGMALFPNYWIGKHSQNNKNTIKVKR